MEAGILEGIRQDISISSQIESVSESSSSLGNSIVNSNTELIQNAYDSLASDTSIVINGENPTVKKAIETINDLKDSALDVLDAANDAIEAARKKELELLNALKTKVTNKITELTNQIDTLKEQLTFLDAEKDAAKIAEINNKITELNAEKIVYEQGKKLIESRITTVTNFKNPIPEIKAKFEAAVDSIVSKISGGDPSLLNTPKPTTGQTPNPTSHTPDPTAKTTPSPTPKSTAEPTVKSTVTLGGTFGGGNNGGNNGGGSGPQQPGGGSEPQQPGGEPQQPGTEPVRPAPTSDPVQPAITARPTASRSLTPSPTVTPSRSLTPFRTITPSFTPSFTPTMTLTPTITTPSPAAAYISSGPGGSGAGLFQGDATNPDGSELADMDLVDEADVMEEEVPVMLDAVKPISPQKKSGNAVLATVAGLGAAGAVAGGLAYISKKKKDEEQAELEGMALDDTELSEDTDGELDESDKDWLYDVGLDIPSMNLENSDV